MAAKLKPLTSGQLRHICNIEKLNANPDGTPLLDATGAPAATYSLWAPNVRFSIDDWKPTETFLAQQMTRQLSTRIRIRYRPGMAGSAPGSFRLVYLTNPGESTQVYEIYEVIGAVRDANLRIDMNLTCTLRDADGYRTGAPES